MNRMHVYPVNDLVEHDIESDGCVCGPESRPIKHDETGEVSWVIKHHSLDGRELTEP